MTADLTAHVADLAARIETSLAEDEATAKAAQARFPGPWEQADNTDSPLPGAVTLYDSRDESVGVIRGSYAAGHIARNYPDRVLRRVKATRDLVAVILAEQHYTAEAGYYSCSQAREGQYLIGGPTGPPGSGCGDPERAGEPCDCGRDDKVARMLGIIANEWEDIPDG